jgi:autotransporter-associated beta strand protein
MNWIHSLLRRLGVNENPNRKARRKYSRPLTLIPLEERVTPASLTWTGGGSDTNWSTAANWGGATPQAGDSLSFGDLGGSITSTNDMTAGTSFASITIAGAGYTISGNSVALTGDVTTTYSSGLSTLGFDVELGGGDVSVSSGGMLTMSGIISGTAGLAISGGGTLSLTGSSSNTYSGSTSLSAGVLNLNKTVGHVSVTGNLSIGTGSTTSASVIVLQDEQIADTGTISLSGANAILSLTNGFDETVAGLSLNGGMVMIGTGSLDVGAGGVTTLASNDLSATISSSSGGDIRSTGQTFAINAANTSSSTDLVMAIEIGSATGLSKSGAGTVSFEGSDSNSYTGTTTVTAGTLLLAKSSGATAVTGHLTIGDGTGTDTVQLLGDNQIANSGNISLGLGGVLDLNNFDDSIGALSLTGSQVQTGSGTLTLGGNITANTSNTQSIISGNLDLGGATRTISIGGGTPDPDLIISANISGTGAGLTFTGGITGAELRGNNTYDGLTLISSGVVRAASATALGSAASGTVVSSGATLALTGNTTITAEALSIAGSGVGGVLGALNGFVPGETNTFAGPITLTGNTTISVSSGTLVLSGIIDETGGARNLIKSGSSGTLVLSAANSYSGTTTVSNGILRVENDDALGSTTGETIITNGSVYFAGTNLSVAEDFTMTGAGFNSDGALFVSSGSTLLSGDFSLTGTTEIGAASGATLEISGVIDDGGSTFGIDITNGATGRTILSGTNLFDDALTINAGFGRLTSAGAAGNTATTRTISVANAATLELAGGFTLPATQTVSLTLNGVTGSSKVVSVSSDNTIAGNIVFNGNESFSVASGTTLTVDGIISQTGGIRNLILSGTGTLDLNGTNSYSGGTFVNGGMLIVDGDISSSSGVTVSSGATVGGSGTFPAISLSSGAVLAPGNSPGILRSGNLTLASDSTLSIELDGSTAGTGYDQLDVTGTVDVTGATLSVSLGFTPTLGDSFVIINNDSTDAVTGNFLGLSEGANLTVSSQIFRLSYVGGDGNDVTLTALEAPSVVVSSNANPSVFGQAVTFSVVVSGTGVTPTGNVTLFIDGASVETVALASGEATFTAISSLSVTTHEIAVTYEGGGIYASETQTLSSGQVVNSADTTTSVISLDLTTVFGEQVTFMAIVGAASPGSGTPTGSVEFFDGVTSLGTSSLTSGVAMLSTSILSVAGHTITAVYLGDSNFTTSTSSSITQVVGQASSTTSLSSSDTTTQFSESVTFTATVSPVSPSAATPTGSVEFFDGAVSLGTASLSAGVATLTTSNLSVAGHSITAVYLGSSGFSGSTSNSVSQTVAAADTSTVLDSSDLTTVFGEMVTLTASVSLTGLGMATPTGSVEFFNGATSLGTVTLSGGVATLMLSSLPVASNTLTAVYTGTTGFSGSTSGSISQVVSPAESSISVGSGDLMTVFGESVTFTATVTAVTPGSGIPTGSVEFFDGSTSLGTVTLSSGVATLSTSLLSVATHSITAVYATSTNFNGSTSSAIAQVVSLASTTTTVQSSDVSTVFGETVVFTASVSVVAPGAGTISGDVEFYDGVTFLGSATISGMVATLSVSDLSFSAHGITAIYLGNASFASSTSTSLTQTVSSSPTTTTVSTNLPEVDFREAVIFTAQVTPSGGGAGIPTGVVRFFANGEPLGESTLNSSGIATFTTSSLPSGDYTISATYTPNNGNFLASMGDTAQVVSATVGNDVNGDGSDDIIIGTASGSSHIRVTSSDGTEIRSFFAFDGFTGGVSNAGGDVNDDGLTDVIVGTSNGSSHVKVFDGSTGETRFSFFAFDGFAGGVKVASGDVNGDGFDDLVVATARGSSHVKVFSGLDGSLLQSFLAFDGFTGGVEVAAGDIDGDGKEDILVGTLTGSSHVKVFSGADNSLLRSFFAFDNFAGGVSVSAGDLDGDGKADIIVGAAQGSSHVKVFSGADNSLLRSFFALPNFSGNLSVAVADVDNDGDLDIIAGDASGGSRVVALDGLSLTEIDSFNAFEDFLGGVSIS